jgi:hypothetical protein
MARKVKKMPINVNRIRMELDWINLFQYDRFYNKLI